MRHAVLPLVLAAALLAACKSIDEGADVETWRGSDRGQPFDPDPAAVIAAQRYYIKRLYGELEPRGREEFNRHRRHLAELARATMPSASCSTRRCSRAAHARIMDQRLRRLYAAV